MGSGLELRRTARLLAGLRWQNWAVLGAVSVLLAASPLVTLFIVKYLVDNITVLATARSGALSWVSAIWVPITAYFLVNVIADSAETLQLLQISTLRDQIGFEVENRTVTKTLSHHDLGIFDRPEIKKLLTLATDATAHGQYLVQLLSNLATGILLAGPTLFIAASLGGWIPLLVLATTIPATLMQLRYERKAWDVEAAHVDLNNRAQQLRAAMLSPRYGGDIRAHLMHAKLLPRWQSQMRSLLAARRTVRNRGTVLVLLLAILSGTGLLVPYGFVIAQAIAGNISLGTLALFIGLIPELRRSLFVVCANAGEVTGAARQLTALWKFEDTAPAVVLDPLRDTARSCAATPPAPAITFNRVSFSYSPSGPSAISDVNLVMPAGSTTLLVGENGTGKTTLAKLLCRFYDPTSGSITVDGVDLRSIDILDFRHRTAVLMQDPARLPMSVRSCLSPATAAVSDTAIADALRDVGLLDEIERTPHGLDTELSTSLNSGIDLSGGQWQRLAVARLLLHIPHSSLAVIDEPTTALDPTADRNLSDLILDRCAEMTTLIISHRLHFASHVTQVALTAHGCPLAVGAHDELIETNATYRQMLAIS